MSGGSFATHMSIRLPCCKLGMCLCEQTFGFVVKASCSELASDVVFLKFLKPPDCTFVSRLHVIKNFTTNGLAGNCTCSISNFDAIKVEKPTNCTQTQPLEWGETLYVNPIATIGFPFPESCNYMSHLCENVMRLCCNYLTLCLVRLVLNFAIHWNFSFLFSSHHVFQELLRGWNGLFSTNRDNAVGALKVLLNWIYSRVLGAVMTVVKHLIKEVHNIIAASLWISS